MTNLILSDFTDHVGGAFRLSHADGERMMTLTEAKALSAGGKEGDDTPGRQGGAFSLLFENIADDMLPQGIYRIEHPRHDGIDLFLVPVGACAGGFVYESVFN